MKEVSFFSTDKSAEKSRGGASANDGFPDSQATGVGFRKGELRGASNQYSETRTLNS